MRAARHSVFTIVICGLAMLSAPALGQTKCPDGMTAGGKCVEGSLAAAMRERVRVFTQPRLSYTGPAVGPDTAHRYDALRDWGQALRREIYGPCIPTIYFCP
jgi:hypothetical protein